MIWDNNNLDSTNKSIISSNDLNNYERENHIMKVEYFKKLKEYEELIKRKEQLTKRIKLSDNRRESFSEKRDIINKNDSKF